MAQPLPTAFEKEVQQFKLMQQGLQQNYQARQTLIAQQQENALVQTEFERLEEDAVIYKLIGPVLVKQDPKDAKTNVEKRIEYITGELKRMDEVVENAEKELTEKRNDLAKLQESQQKAQASTA